MEEPKQRRLNQPLFDLDRPGMTKSEQLRFQAMRKSGALTFFDCRGCEVCGTEIPLVKRYCSPACASKAAKEGSDASD